MAARVDDETMGWRRRRHQDETIVIVQRPTRFRVIVATRRTKATSVKAIARRHAMETSSRDVDERH